MVRVRVIVKVRVKVRFRRYRNIYILFRDVIQSRLYRRFTKILM